MDRQWIKNLKEELVETFNEIKKKIKINYVCKTTVFIFGLIFSSWHFILKKKTFVGFSSFLLSLRIKVCVSVVNVNVNVEWRADDSILYW